MNAVNMRAEGANFSPQTQRTFSSASDGKKSDQIAGQAQEKSERAEVVKVDYDDYDDYEEPKTGKEKVQYPNSK
jgi:hypothetical protein